MKNGLKLFIFFVFIIIILIKFFSTDPSVYSGKKKLHKELIPLNKKYSKRVKRIKIRHDGTNPKINSIQSYQGNMETLRVNNIKINGMPSKIISFQTKDRPSVVMNKYFLKWRAEGREVFEKKFPRYITLSGFSPVNKNFKNIIILQDPASGKTQVFHTIMKMDKTIYTNNIKDVPGFISKRKNLQVEEKGGGKVAQTFIDFTEKNVLNSKVHYRNNMIKDGWKEYNSKSHVFSELEKNDFLFFTKDKKECLINFQPLKKRAGTLILVNITKKKR